MVVVPAGLHGDVEALRRFFLTFNGLGWPNKLLQKLYLSFEDIPFLRQHCNFMFKSH